MANISAKLLLSIVSNIIIIPLFLSAIVVEIIDIINNPNSIYQNIWGIFRYFSYDGSIISVIISIIMLIKNCKALKIPEDDEYFRDKALSHFIYMISLVSACNALIILLISLILLFIPISSTEWKNEYKPNYRTMIICGIIPIIIIIRFLAFDKGKRDLKLYEKFVGVLSISIYTGIMISLSGANVFTSFDKKEGDGKIPYPFFDFYHRHLFFCLAFILSIIIFGCASGIFLEYLHNLIEYIGKPREVEKKEEEKQLVKDNQRLFAESTTQAY